MSDPRIGKDRRSCREACDGYPEIKENQFFLWGDDLFGHCIVMLQISALREYDF